jgi:hypothetical protein
MFLYHTQPVPKQSIKIFFRHFHILVPSLTLQISNFVQSNLENKTSEFLAIVFHIPDHNVRSRGKGKFVCLFVAALAILQLSGYCHDCR